jgi:hypothetical protein
MSKLVAICERCFSAMKQTDSGLRHVATKKGTKKKLKQHYFVEFQCPKCHVGKHSMFRAGFRGGSKSKVHALIRRSAETALRKRDLLQSEATHD